MKHKKALLRLLMFALSFCFLSASCKKEYTPDESSFHTTAVQRSDVVEYGNFVYFSSGRICRYNIKTGEAMPACMEAECNNSDPLDCPINYFAGVYEGRVYFSGFQAYTYMVFIAYQDIATGDVCVLKTMSREEDTLSYVNYLDQGYLYYRRMILKPDGDPKKSEDYEQYICRMTVDGENDTPIVKYDASESLIAVLNGKMLTLLDGVLYITDVETLEKSFLYDLPANGYLPVVSASSTLNGKLYFMAPSWEKKPDQIGLPPSYLLVADMTAGTVNRVLEENMIYFCLTDNAIYYTPYKMRYTYMPEDAEEHPEKIPNPVYFDETLYACDLDGKNIRAVYTNDRMDYAEQFTVIDNVLYGLLFDYDEETHTFDGGTWFGSINFETGEIHRS